jgi:hypothetical protein
VGTATERRGLGGPTNQHGPLGLRGVATSCEGCVCGFGTGYELAPASVVAHCWMTSGAAETGEGRGGTELSGDVKLNAVVRSPTVARRHALKFGTSAPNLVSRNFKIDA